MEKLFATFGKKLLQKTDMPFDEFGNY